MSTLWILADSKNKAVSKIKGVQFCDVFACFDILLRKRNQVRFELVVSAYHQVVVRCSFFVTPHDRAFWEGQEVSFVFEVVLREDIVSSWNRYNFLWYRYPVSLTVVA